MLCLAERYCFLSVAFKSRSYSIKQYGTIKAQHDVYAMYVIIILYVPCIPLPTTHTHTYTQLHTGAGVQHGSRRRQLPLIPAVVSGVSLSEVKVRCHAGHRIPPSSGAVHSQCGGRTPTFP